MLFVYNHGKKLLIMTINLSNTRFKRVADDI